ncbi:hypothetical protein HAP48_0037510 [Bradyrhizobium septentrionale]|uniref:Uncharacterized protein n=1 Tax=Bradyrhizobium septentrionale TaxID=1404411 RepID=A0A973W0N5_9BRAD|nr:hypothetical protein [Bradyrhizobium septentrionale]UGY14216.1 hypothetical protein HAP48_0037510 [Bradyrhizobium septentrionale]
MKVSVIEVKRKRVEAIVNQRYMADGHDIAHDRKRTLAAAVAAGAEPSAEFAEAAAVEGVTPQALAQTILAKPDELMTKENKRRSMVVRTRAAKTVAELEAIQAEADATAAPPLTSRIFLQEGR